MNFKRRPDLAQHTPQAKGAVIILRALGFFGAWLLQMVAHIVKGCAAIAARQRTTSLEVASGFSSTNKPHRPGRRMALLAGWLSALPRAALRGPGKARWTTTPSFLRALSPALP